MPREELIALVMMLQAENAGLRTAIEQLRSEIEALRKQIKGPLANSENSSQPPSRDRKGDGRLERKHGERGAKAGHERKVRPLVDKPDQIIEAKVASCAGCGQDLRGVTPDQVIRRQVTELPEIKPAVIETQQAHVTCPGCGAHNCGELPEGLAAGRQFGPRLEAVLVYFMHQQHMSYARAQAALEELFGIEISEGGEARVMERAGELAQVKADQIAEVVKCSPVIGSDETSGRVDKDNWWEWTFVSTQGVVHVFEYTREAKAISNFMGEHRAEVWVSDLHKSQLTAPTQTHQICLAHQIRDVKRLIEEQPDLSWAIELQNVFKAAIHLRHKRDNLRKQLKTDDPREPMNEPWFKRQRTALENQLDTLLKRPVPPGRAETLRERYRTHRDHLFVFLYDARVPPTNNACERALRPSVIHRKVSNGFRSSWGPRAYAALSTVIDTAKLKGQAVFETLVNLMGLPLLQFLQPAVAINSSA